jgi:hypothetical protein
MLCSSICLPISCISLEVMVKSNAKLSKIHFYEISCISLGVTVKSNGKLSGIHFCAISCISLGVTVKSNAKLSGIHFCAIPCISLRVSAKSNAELSEIQRLSSQLCIVLPACNLTTTYSADVSEPSLICNPYSSLLQSFAIHLPFLPCITQFKSPLRCQVPVQLPSQYQVNLNNPTTPMSRNYLYPFHQL